MEKIHILFFKIIENMMTIAQLIILITIKIHIVMVIIIIIIITTIIVFNIIINIIIIIIIIITSIILGIVFILEKCSIQSIKAFLFICIQFNSIQLNRI